MNRDEEIRELANKYRESYAMGFMSFNDIVECIIEWADEHPIDANKATMIVQPVDTWYDAKEHKPDAVEQKEFGARKLSRQVLAVYDDGKCHVERYDHDCDCWRWANGYGQMHEPKMWRYIDIPEGGTK